MPNYYLGCNTGLRSTGQAQQVGTVLRGRRRVFADDGLVGDERSKTDYPSSYAHQFGDLFTERLIRPFAPAILKWCVDAPLVIAGQERNFEPDAPTLVARVPILACLRAVRPTLAFEESGKPAAVVVPHRDVEVPVRSRYPADVEVDCPAAKEPVGDAVALKQMVEFR